LTFHPDVITESVSVKVETHFYWLNEQSQIANPCRQERAAKTMSHFDSAQCDIVFAEYSLKKN